MDGSRLRRKLLCHHAHASDKRYYVIVPVLLNWRYINGLRICFWLGMLDWLRNAITCGAEQVIDGEI